MTFEPLASLLPIVIGLMAGQPGAAQPAVTRLIMRNQVIWRIPVIPRAPASTIDWVEHKGPRCIPANSIRRALLYSPEQVDFILANRSRVRAKFIGNCAALDFYAGFYLQPEDGFLCAKRDSVRSRMGASCAIGKFRQLEPRPKR